MASDAAGPWTARAAVTAIGCGLLMVATACGSGSAPVAGAGTTPRASARGHAADGHTHDASGSGGHNDADHAFVDEMGGHHQQGVELSRLALTRTRNPAVRTLAVDIIAAQESEIVRMSGWSQDWGGGHDHPGHTGHPGMLSPQQITGLAGLTGTSFDRSWLTGMSSHHRGAVAMARTEAADGANPEARQLAATIVETQTEQVAEMERLLSQLSTD